MGRTETVHSESEKWKLRYVSIGEKAIALLVTGGGEILSKTFRDLPGH